MTLLLKKRQTGTSKIANFRHTIVSKRCAKFQKITSNFDWRVLFGMLEKPFSDRFFPVKVIGHILHPLLFHSNSSIYSYTPIRVLSAMPRLCLTFCDQDQLSSSNGSKVMTLWNFNSRDTTDNMIEFMNKAVNHSLETCVYGIFWFQLVVCYGFGLFTTDFSHILSIYVDL